MKIDDVHRILIVGAGTMGQQIGFQCAAHGYEVVLYDVATQALDDAQRRMTAYADELIDQGVITVERRDAALKNVSATTDPRQAARAIDLISESVPEDPKLKGQVFAQFNTLCPSHTLFTTNTSTLIPSQFAKASGRPDRVIALHFHQPIWTSNVVDVMPHRDTSPEVTALTLEFARRIGQIPIHIQKESHNYVFNAMFSAINREALTLAANGVASVEDIDRAWMGIMKMPIGPFGLMDFVGLDTVWHISHYWARRAFFLRQLKKNADFVKTYVDRGWLGMKSGHGFYTYPNPAYQQSDFITSAKHTGHTS
jgi:3-hydroxybutyryl-CoA dehydrogenase